MRVIGFVPSPRWSWAGVRRCRHWSHQLSSAQVITPTATTTGGGTLRDFWSSARPTAVLAVRRGPVARTLIAVDAFDRGFAPKRAVDARRSAGLEVPTPQSLEQFFDRCYLPGVAGVAWASDLQLDFFDPGELSFASSAILS
jgi:hypothetical protein